MGNLETIELDNATSVDGLVNNTFLPDYEEIKVLGGDSFTEAPPEPGGGDGIDPEFEFSNWTTAAHEAATLYGTLSFSWLALRTSN